MSIKRVTTRAIEDSQITTDKLADGAITAAKITDGSITTSKIAEGAVGSMRIADGAVTGAKILDGAVSLNKLAADSVDASKIADGAVTNGKLATDAVGTANIAAGAVTSAKLATDAVAATNIAANAVTTAKIADASITPAKLSGAQSGLAPIYGARAWVNFNGTGTVAIIASANVSSITDNGLGTYTVNFTTAMPDANYAVSGSGRAAATSGTTAFAAINIVSDVAPTTSAVRIRHVDQNTIADGSRISVVIHS